MRDSKGRFLPGPDEDRHKLTRAERRKGFRRAVRVCERFPDPWHTVAWLHRRVRGWYAMRKQEAPAGGPCPF